MLDYRIISLTPDQVEWRRKELDRAGYEAYLAPIILLSFVLILRHLSKSSAQNPVPSSQSIVTSRFRRLFWLLNTNYNSDYGTLQVQVLGVAYSVYLLQRSLRNTGQDYMHVTKAFGHVAVSQLPMHYLLSIKWPHSPITWATGLTHERLNAYHRIFGRIIHSFLAAHAVLYLAFFVRINALTKRIKDLDVQLGIACFWTVNLIGILSLSLIRKRAYHQLFYRSHIILSMLLLGFLWFHVRYSRIYVAQAATFWLANGIFRKAASRDAQVKVENLGSDLILVRATLTGRPSYSFIPGCHVYLNMPGLGPRTPFSVVSTGESAAGYTEVKLVAKVSYGPMTGRLAAAAASSTMLSLQLEGPYGEAQIYMPDLLRAVRAGKDHFLLIAGGVGATYVLPICKALEDAASGANIKQPNITVLWTVRKTEDLSWAEDTFSTGTHTTKFYLFLTQETSVEKSSRQNVEVCINRPNLTQFVNDFMKPRLKTQRSKVKLSNTEELASQGIVHVLVCGPSTLSASVHKAVGKHVNSQGPDVRWYEEQFGFGG